VKLRTYSFPGITPRIVEESGLPLEGLLAHAEAEVLLRSVGWTPVDRYVVERVAPTKARGRASPPRSPPRGCVPWVAVGIGLDGAVVTHASGYSRSDPSRGMFVLGAISCAGSGGGPPDVTEIQFDDDGGDGGTISFRPYAAPSGPAVAGSGAAVVSVVELRPIAADDLDLPDGQEVRGDAAP
jgi:hypothetical protein